MKKSTLLLLVGLMPLWAYSQKVMKTYYDYEHQHVKESYTTDNYGVKTGAYILYTQYGGILTQGAYKNDKQIGKWIVKDEKGVLLSETMYDNDGLPNGHSIDYKDGHKEFEGDYLHGLNKVGHWRTWYTTDDGANAYAQLHYDEYYKNGMYDSIWTEYSITGKIKKQCHYKIGVLNGETATYNEQGMSLIKGNYLNGICDGDWVYYDEGGNGEVMGKDKFKNGKPFGECRVSFNSKWQNTKNKSNAVYYRIVNYSEDGSSKATDYYITGEKQAEETYNVSNKITGPYVQYYKNGKVYQQGKYNDNGKEESIWITYYQNGIDSIKAKYVNGGLDSTYTSFYDNGKVYIQGDCRNNTRIGNWKILDNNGNLIFMEDFNGNPMRQAILHYYKNGQEIKQSGTYVSSDDIQYANVWPWPNSNLLMYINRYTR